MFKVLELSRLFVCLGAFVKIFSAWEEKLLGCDLLGGGGGEFSNQADTMTIYKSQQKAKTSWGSHRYYKLLIAAIVI